MTQKWSGHFRSTAARRACGQFGAAALLFGDVFGGDGAVKNHVGVRRPRHDAQVVDVRQRVSRLADLAAAGMLRSSAAWAVAGRRRGQSGWWLPGHPRFEQVALDAVDDVVAVHDVGLGVHLHVEADQADCRGRSRGSSGRARPARRGSRGPCPRCARTSAGSGAAPSSGSMVSLTSIAPLCRNKQLLRQVPIRPSSRAKPVSLGQDGGD